jgi:copper chaperone CopZ
VSRGFSRSIARAWAPLLAVLLMLATGCARERYQEPAPLDGQRRVRLDIETMTDPSSVARVQHHLSLVPGVRHVEVNLEKRCAQITCESSVTDSSLVEAARTAGAEGARAVAY